MAKQHHHQQQTRFADKPPTPAPPAVPKVSEPLVDPFAGEAPEAIVAEEAPPVGLKELAPAEPPVQEEEPIDHTRCLNELWQAGVKGDREAETKWLNALASLNGLNDNDGPAK